MSKASTLEQLLSAAPTDFVIDPFLAFTVVQWQRDPEEILAHILDSLSGETFIVRSSTVAESEQRSSAGAYGSVSGVGRDTLALRDAVTSVVGTYTRDGRRPAAADRVIVQQQVTRPRVAGVVTTLDDTALPYFTIAYDTSGRTNAVTRGERSTVVRIRRGAAPPDAWSGVVAAAAQVCRIMSDQDLVIEFAQDDFDLVHVFQAWTRRRRPAASEADVQAREKAVSEEYNRLGRPVASTMSDWNPAEILGRHPSRLAISLYEELVTRRVWSEARAELGYFAPPGDLMFVLDGTPFINVEQSLKSLTPYNLREQLRREIVDTQLQSLAANTALHDKLEWRIAMSSAVLGEDPRVHSLREETRLELTRALTSLTNQILVPRVPSRPADHHVAAITEARESLVGQPLTPDALARCLDTLRKHGTLPFAIHARMAFMLRDLVAQGIDCGALPVGSVDLCLRHSQTGAAALTTALSGVLTGALQKNEFLAKFGHLRPATYEVESPRYDSAGVLDFMLHTTGPFLDAAVPELPDYPNDDAFTALLASAGVSLDGASVLVALTAEMSERERLKFSFTGLLSDLLEAIAAAGASRGLSRAEIASIPITSILADRWEPNAESWHLSMPDVLTPSLSLSFVEIGTEEPTFAGTGAFSGSPIVINRDFLPTEPPARRVVLMESAEPGCDWILSSGLGALATAYGGSASHMAIRAAELGIPMAIGCGLETLNRLAGATNVLIDADRKLLTTGL